MYSGSCLCKKVSFEVVGELKGFFLCHCSRCRKVTGSAHASNLFSTTASLEWKSGEEHVKTYSLPETRFKKSFCESCGSALPILDQSRLLIPAGCLDSEVGMRPDAHIFMGSRADWDHDLESIAAFEDVPPRNRTR